MILAETVLIRAKRRDISNLAIVVGDPARAEQLSLMLCEARLVSSNRGYLTYTGYFNNSKVTIATHGIGGPSAIVFEELRMLGARTLVRLGTCGAMVKRLDVEDLVIPTAAACQSGRFSTILPEGVVLPPVADLDLQNRLIESCRLQKIGFSSGIVYSSDYFYNETMEFTNWAKRGVIAIDMECATLFTFGLLRGFKAAALLLVSDSLVRKTKEFTTAREMKRASNEAGKVVLQALTKEKQVLA